MRYTTSITPITLGLNTVVCVPESWTGFVFNGFLYVRDEFGRFVVRGTWAKKTA